MKNKILVGLSGGVDSAVAALLLKEQGYDVIGATMAIWGNREVKGMAHKSSHKGGACFGPDEKEDIEEARKIAQRLDIPYYVFDCAKEYEEIVLKYFKSEYIKGRTPNPCIWCNALVKFGVLPHIARLHNVQFDKFATGHYARVFESNGRFGLKQAIVPEKDQSYFLYKLTQEQLKDIILPLGNYTKSQIRKIALDFGLEVATKPDSQDFYEGDYNELLSVKQKEGNIVDTEGKVLGKHKGIWNYTIGQRKGLGVSSTEPLYVLSLDNEKNEVVVGFLDKTFKKTLAADNLNFVSIEKIDKKIDVKAKIRSTQKSAKAFVEPLEEGKIKVTFEEYQKSIALGQSVVLYDNETNVLCGGIIETVE